MKCAVIAYGEHLGINLFGRRQWISCDLVIDIEFNTPSGCILSSPPQMDAIYFNFILPPNSLIQLSNSGALVHIISVAPCC